MRSLLIPALFLSSTAYAVPAQFTHQGRLMDADGLPLEGETGITFRLIDEETGGEVLWSETITVLTSNGFYSAVLGTDEVDNPLDVEVLDQAPLWLEIQLDDVPAMFPRTAVHSVPYATMATVAEEVAGGPVDAAEIAIDGTLVINDAGEWVGPASTVSWDEIEGVPADFADGVDDVSDSMADLGVSCLDGDVPVWDGVLAEWACGLDQDTLADLDCADGQLIRWNDTTLGWACGEDADTVLSAEEVDAIVADNGYAFASDLFSGSFEDLTGIPEALEDGDDDSLAAISCGDGQVLLYSLSSGGWTCGTDTDTTLTSAEVQAMVESMATLALGAGTTIGGESPLVESSTLQWSQLSGVPDGLADGDDDAFAGISCAEGEFLTVEEGSWACAPFDGDGDGVPVWTDCDDDDTSLGSRLTDSDCDAEEDSEGESAGTVMYGNYNVYNSVDLANLAGYTEVTGNLIINAGGIPDIDELTSLTTVGGDIEIEWNSALTDLAGLANLRSVGGHFRIKYNYGLTSISGLNNLVSVASDLELSQNTALTEISGFGNLTSVNHIDVTHHDALISINGFNSLTEIGGRLNLNDNAEITDLSGFSHLASIGQNLNIENLDSLTDLNEFSSLISVGDWLGVRYNDELNDIAALSEISGTSGGSLAIHHNPNLCQSLVDDLVDLIGHWFTGTDTWANRGC